MTDAERILELEEQVEELEAELEDALAPPPPDWFAQHESYEQMYARLHAGWPDVKGTNPAPWAW
jgi:hypothetical protein